MLGEPHIPRSPNTGIPGWETDPEETYLRKLASAVPKRGKIVELGAEYGRSAGSWCAAAEPTVMIVSVDLFPTNHPHVGDLHQAYLNNLREAGYENRTTPIRSDSAKAGHEWIGGPIHLLFIDADHSYAAVCRDIEAWVPHVEINGVVAFHDCARSAESHHLHLEVSQAVDEWKARVGTAWRELPKVDTLRVFRRVA